MKRIRFLGIFLVFFTLFANTTFGQLAKKIEIVNKSQETAYCAYSYFVDEEIATSTGESIGWRVEGWLEVPPGSIGHLPYNSNHTPFVYFIMGNGASYTLDAKNGSVHPVPAQLLDVIKGRGVPRADKFKIIQDPDGTVKASTIIRDDSFESVPRFEVVTFYSPKTRRITIPGRVEAKRIITHELMDSRFDSTYDRRGFVREGKDYALLFATDIYKMDTDPNEPSKLPDKDSPWEDLARPIADAEALETALKTYGFEVELVKNVKTREDYLEKIVEYGKIDYGPTDQLFVYFAGHGHFREEDPQDGFIAASDSKHPDEDPGFSTYLSYAQLKQDLDRLDCPRVMLMLDVCYGGTFDKKIALNERPGTRGSSTRALQQKLGLKDLKNTLSVKTRWYISSGGKEVVFDGGEDADHSPFAAALLHLFKVGAGADGVLTVPEIERHLPSTFKTELRKVENAYKAKNPSWTEEFKQTPSSGAFASGKPEAKAFVFIKKTQ